MARPLLLGILLAMISAGMEAQQRRDVFIPVGPADSLDATIFTPDSPPPTSHGYPTMLFVHGFGSDKQARIPSASLYAAMGYMTLAYLSLIHI